MDETSKIIDQHLRSERFKNSKFAIAVFALLLVAGAFAMYNLFSPVVERTKLVGVVESLHLGHSVTGTDVDQFYVRLDDGSLVNVPIGGDRGIPFRKHAKVEIEKTIKASGKVNYAFKGYVQ